MSNSRVEQLAAELIRRNWMVAVAESVTGGRIQALLTSCSGASQYFAGGLTAYSLAQKVHLLGVDSQHAQHVNCVSERVCTQMARGAAELFQTSVALAITGYAEPDEAWNISRPMAIVSVWCGPTATADQASSTPITLYADGHRAAVQTAFAERAVDHLLHVVRTRQEVG